MKRREEITQTAKNKYPYIKGLPQSASHQAVFIEAAEWADKTLIEKACDWIESYLFDIGFPDDWCRDSATMKSGKQRFLEAMEE